MQAIAYKGIIEMQLFLERKGTSIYLNMIRWAAMEQHEEMPTDKQIWKFLQDKDLFRQIRAFMWRAMHNGYKLENY